MHLLVWREQSRGKLIVELDHKSTPRSELGQCLGKCGPQPLSIDLESKGGQQFAQLPVGAADAIAQFRQDGLWRWR
jgi:hypothetical protein